MALNELTHTQNTRVEPSIGFEPLRELWLTCHFRSPLPTHVCHRAAIGEWGFGCGNTTSANHRFTLKDMQDGGRSIGSKVEKASAITVVELTAKAKALLGLTDTLL